MNDFPEFMNARQVAEYIDLNEKKVYSLANDGVLPATKITGKWLFPKSLLDRWLLESSHNGVFNDRLLIAGSDDPLLQHIVSKMAATLGSTALVGYTATGTKQGLAMLEKGHVDMCAIHWGNAEEAKLRHPALLQQYSGHKNWVLVHGFERLQGLIVRPEQADKLNDPYHFSDKRWRWAGRQDGAGSARAMDEWLFRNDMTRDTLNTVTTCLSERELGSAIARGSADIGFGSKSAAGEFGLAFLPIANEAFELVIPKNIYFRTLVQQVIHHLDDEESRQQSDMFGGYDFQHTGKQMWSAS
ncbi:helix-turn-helix domain-containing protein [Enterovibrio norvegicus]|uniref:helix-turn-helix transcriptional regulator n=1 Tax=Enterovibrio norvegicus TaxID=188144 RepID=UPI000C82BFE8|nr:helix-turn-helix transcriptional regulator [Enterovibrio norvegicus]PMI30127.1 DNA-binding protein [Enterovibrio norvegicus]TKF18523.1 helix-turn-helix domain-containing protein [Enterovibrio norvegicus]